MTIKNKKKSFLNIMSNINRCTKTILFKFFLYLAKKIPERVWGWVYYIHLLHFKLKDYQSLKIYLFNKTQIIIISTHSTFKFFNK